MKALASKKRSKSKRKIFFYLFYSMLFLIILVALIMLINNIYYIKTGEVINSNIVNCTWSCTDTTCGWYPLVTFNDSNGKNIISQVSLSYSAMPNCPQKIGENLIIRYVKSRDNVLMASENGTYKVIIFVLIGIIIGLIAFLADRFRPKNQKIIEN